MESTMKTRMMLPLLLVAAGFITPASANFFSNPYTGVTLNIGSAPNPTPQDIRESRLPAVTQDDQDSGAAAKPTDKTAVNTTPERSPAPQSGGAGNIPTASPSR
jgi:hypothetical protein